LIVSAAVLAGCGTSSSPSAAPSADGSQGFTPRNDARISLGAPVAEDATLALTGSAEDPEFAGLTRYDFSDPAAGFSFSISLDPATSMTGAVATSEELVLGFTVGEDDFVSSAEECAVTFVNFSDTVIDGEFECEIPSADPEVVAEGTGIFAFAP
jgi:hypothetical protein